jgi:signal peptidase II
MRRRLEASACILLWVASDQWTKALAQELLMHRGRLSYFGDVFRWEYAENLGAFLSLGARLSPQLRFLLLTGLVGVFLLGGLVYLWKENRLDRWTNLAMASLLGGGVSNLGDRVFREHGQVVDFMNLGIGDLRTGIFNIADVAIMGGAIAMVLLNFRRPNSTGWVQEESHGSDSAEESKRE